MLQKSNENYKSNGFFYVLESICKQKQQLCLSRCNKQVKILKNYVNLINSAAKLTKNSE